MSAEEARRQALIQLGGVAQTKENYRDHRGVAWLETLLRARRVAVVNRTLVDKYFPNEDPIGHQIKFNVFDRIPVAPRDAYFEIVGVVSDFRNFGLSEEIQPEAFFPYTFSSFGDRSLIVRTANDPGFFADTIRVSSTRSTRIPSFLTPAPWTFICTNMTT